MSSAGDGIANKYRKCTVFLPAFATIFHCFLYLTIPQVDHNLKNKVLTEDRLEPEPRIRLNVWLKLFCATAVFES